MPAESSVERTAKATVTQPGFAHGSKAVGASAVQLTTADVPLQKGLTVKAKRANPGLVYVGKDAGVTAETAEATDGFELTAGESLTLEVDNANRIWLIGSGAGQRIFWIAT